MVWFYNLNPEITQIYHEPDHSVCYWNGHVTTRKPQLSAIQVNLDFGTLLYLKVRCEICKKDFFEKGRKDEWIKPTSVNRGPYSKFVLERLSKI